jgi:hypothetical protein
METKDLAENKNIYMVFIQGGGPDKRTIWQREIGMEGSNVVFVMRMR